MAERKKQDILRQVGMCKKEVFARQPKRKKQTPKRPSGIFVVGSGIQTVCSEFISQDSETLVVSRR